MESDRRLYFLDKLWLSKNGNRIKTDVFYKKNRIQNNILCLILAILGTPNNLARRLCTIISDTRILDTRLKELQVLLLQRHSPRKLILNGITKTVYLDRKELLTVKTQIWKYVKTIITSWLTSLRKNHKYLFTWRRMFSQTLKALVIIHVPFKGSFSFFWFIHSFGLCDIILDFFLILSLHFVENKIWMKTYNFWNLSLD